MYQKLIIKMMTESSIIIRLFAKNMVRPLVAVLLMFGMVLSAKAEIKGKIVLDTNKWAPVAYLSLIPDFTQINTISYEYIIERSLINHDGSFSFKSGFLPDDEHLYRIHLSKKDDPPSSLIIGGKDHNHFFLFAKNNSDINIESKTGENLFNKLTFHGNYPNTSLLEISSMLNMLDTLDYFGATLNQDFIRESIYQRLRDYADTCSHPLLSLYAIYQGNYETDILIRPDYYNSFLDKWEDEDSDYFDTFRNNTKEKSLSSEEQLGIIGIISIIILLLTLLFFNRRRINKKSLLSMLTIQERKILTYLKQGKSNKEIADECSISISTVKSHVNSIYSKLGVSSRKEVMDYTEQ
jgi:DNA-binding CsgD family transcriptional regulator